MMRSRVSGEGYGGGREGSGDEEREIGEIEAGERDWDWA